MGAEHLGVEVRQHPDLVVAADGRHHRRDLRVGERGVQVPGAVAGIRVQRAGGRILHRHQIELFPQLDQSRLVHLREDRR